VSKYDAIGKLYCGIVEAIVVRDGHFYSFSFDQWLEKSLERDWFPGDWEFIGTSRHDVAVPQVVRCLHYDKVPRAALRLTKRAVHNRDEHTCYICGKKFGEANLSVDHVVPQSRGGKTTWENLASCCKKCNEKKGNKLLSELGIKPIFLPIRPTGTGPEQRIKLQVREIPEQWRAVGL